MKQKVLLVIVGCGLASGCATYGGSRRQPTGLNRTTTTKDASGRTTTTSVPITAKQYPYPAPPVQVGANPSERAIQTESASLALDPGVAYDREPMSFGLEAGYVRTRIWNKLTTDFQSPNFTQIVWNRTPVIRGDGAEASLFLSTLPNEGHLGLRGGTFQDSRTQNSIAEGGTYVRETVKTSGFWIDGEAQFYPMPWLSVGGGLGLFIYELKTSVNTNAAQYTYEGIEGVRAFGVLGVSAGLETPWDFPLRLYTRGRLWFLGTTDEPLVESAVGQWSAGLVWRF